MITELTNSDNAGTVVSRINAAIEEQDKGVDTLGADPNASTVISRVKAAIAAESNDQLEDVTNSDNATDFIRKVNALFASIRNGGSEEPTPDPDYEPVAEDYAYWNGASYIAFGDSITHTGSWAGTPNLVSRYCYLVSMPPTPVNQGDYEGLGMVLTNHGVSGMTMIDNGTYSYPITQGVRVEGTHRSFARELLDNNSTIVSGSGYEYRGPYGVDSSQYDLITLMLGSNDRQQIYTGEGTNPGTIGSPSDMDGPLTLNNFYSAYYRAVERITTNMKQGAVLVLCIPPKATGAGFNLNEDMIAPITAVANRFIAEGKNVAIVNFWDIEETIELKSDGYGVHPTAAGHIILANHLKLRLGQIVHELNLRTE